MTDANLVLGYLDPANFLGGRRTLDREAATAAVQRLADRLRLTLAEAAGGIHRLVNTRMADGVRVATVRRGVDPRGHALLAFGGAAGLHVTAVAGELGMQRIVVPIAASVLSAWGMLNTDLRVELTRGQSQTGGIDVESLNAAFAAMEQEGRARLSWFDGEILVRDTADMRYGEQVFEINVPLDGIPRTRNAIEDAFHAAHERLYTYALRDQDVVLVNASVSVIGRLPAAPVAARNATALPALPKFTRQVFLDSWIEIPVYDFAALAAGQRITGPAIVESDTTTVLLRNKEAARFDPRGWLDIVLDQSAASAPT